MARTQVNYESDNDKKHGLLLLFRVLFQIKKRTCLIISFGDSAAPWTLFSLPFVKLCESFGQSGLPSSLQRRNGVLDVVPLYTWASSSANSPTSGPVSTQGQIGQKGRNGQTVSELF